MSGCNIVPNILKEIFSLKQDRLIMTKDIAETLNKNLNKVFPSQCGKTFLNILCPVSSKWAFPAVVKIHYMLIRLLHTPNSLESTHIINTNYIQCMFGVMMFDIPTPLTSNSFMHHHTRWNKNYYKRSPIPSKSTPSNKIWTWNWTKYTSLLAFLCNWWHKLQKDNLLTIPLYVCVFLVKFYINMHMPRMYHVSL